MLELKTPTICRVHTSAIRELCTSHYAPHEIDAWAGRLFPGAHREAIETRDFFVAELDDRVVGFGQLDREKGEIEAVYVDPTAVRRGVGSALLDAVERCARSADLRSLHLVASLNSVAFYTAAGYRRVREAWHAFPSGTAIACLAMKKDLVNESEAL